jgi:nucleoid DNA-binding protein
MARTTAKTGTRSATPRPRAKAAAADADAAGGVVAGAAAEDAAGPVLKLKDLIERVALRSGAQKKTLKPTIEATLAVLGEALSKGESLNLPPLGKAKVAKTRAAGGGETLTVKLKRGGGARGGKAAGGADGAEPLADPAD